MSKHAPEPWVVNGYLDIWHSGGPGGHMFNADTVGNADRIVACVNACAGMDDPAAELTRLRADLAAAVAERDRLAEALTEIADEKVHKRYIQSILAVSPDCDRGCLWAEAVESIESFARDALAKEGT